MGQITTKSKFNLVWFCLLLEDEDMSQNQSILASAWFGCLYQVTSEFVPKLSLIGGSACDTNDEKWDLFLPFMLKI